MNSNSRSLAIIAVSCAMLLSLGIDRLSASEANLAAALLVAAQTTKQQCINSCRARYRDCRRLKQLPSFECRGVYQDCTRYACTGLGPG